MRARSRDYFCRAKAISTTYSEFVYVVFSHPLCKAHVPYYIVICKGKAVPLQAWSGPEGSRKLRLPDFVTTAQDGG